MSDLHAAIVREESQLNNLIYARGSTGKADAMMGAEDLEAMIADQQAIVDGLRAQTFKLSNA